MPDLSTQLSQYLSRKGSPLASFAPDFIKAGQRYGVDPRFLVAIAGAETEFGKTGNAGAINNPFGWGPHIRFPNYSAAIDTIAKGLTTGPYYKTKGRTTIPQIGATWAPAGAANDPTNLNSNWTRNVSNVYRELGGNPAANVFSNSPSISGPVNSQASAAVPVQLPDATKAVPVLSWNQMFKIHEANQRDILAGRMPNPARMQKMLGLIQGALPITIPQVPNAQVPGTPTARRTASGRYSGNYGFPTGPIDSGKAAAGGEGGTWGGSMPRALWLARAVGATPSSQKRSRRLTASGGVSDHWSGSTQSYAIDLPASGSAGDALLKKLSAKLGVNLKSGTWNNINIDGYRYQVGWRVPGHYDHIHVGVKKA